MAKVGTSNQDRTISLQAAVRSCINKQTPTWNKLTCCSLPDSMGEESDFSASMQAHRKVTSVTTFS